MYKFKKTFIEISNRKFHETDKQVLLVYNKDNLMPINEEIIKEAGSKIFHEYNHIISQKILKKSDCLFTNSGFLNNWKLLNCIIDEKNLENSYFQILETLYKYKEHELAIEIYVDKKNSFEESLKSFYKSLKRFNNEYQNYYLKIEIYEKNQNNSKKLIEFFDKKDKNFINKVKKILLI